jgi:hypothetical protein
MNSTTKALLLSDLPYKPHFVADVIIELWERVELLENRASDKVESPGTVRPEAGPANNRSDEIAIQLQNAINFIPVDCASNIREARAIVMDCIAQLRAVR